MIATTFRLAREAGACVSSYRRLAKHVGGVKKYGENTPIPLAEVADFFGIADALWCLRCPLNSGEVKKVARLLAADFAEHVLPIFEKKHPNDSRPRKAIEAARLYAEGKIGAAAVAAAWAAAGAAARAAAGDAARDAAWAAAGDAARAAAFAAAWAAAWDAAGDAARAAARDAARAAAWDAAWGAARGAAWAAEREWQLKRFTEAIGS